MDMNNIYTEVNINIKKVLSWRIEYDKSYYKC